jgi:hypothetical protein
MRSDTAALRTIQPVEPLHNALTTCSSDCGRVVGDIPLQQRQATCRRVGKICQRHVRTERCRGDAEKTHPGTEL